MIKKERLKQKNEAIIRRTEEDMREIRPLPKKVYRWIKGTLMKSSRYIVYDYNGRKQTTGYCSHCKKQVEVSAPRHRTTGVCPSCRSKIIYLASGKMTQVNDERAFAYLQTTKEGFVVRYFDVKFRHYQWKGNEKRISTETSVHEEYRVFYSGMWQGRSMTARKMYEYGEFKQSGINCFYSIDGDGRYIRTGAVYPGNVNAVLRGQVDNKRLDFSLPCRHLQRVFVTSLIEEYITNPRVEQLLKMKLYNLAKAELETHHNRQEDHKNIKQWLGIGKEDIPILQRINPTKRGLAVYKFVKCHCSGKINMEIFKRLGAVTDGDFMRLMTSCTKYMTLHKLLKYAESQQETKAGEKIELGNFMSLYKDYLRFSETLGRDMKSGFVLWPRDLHAAHDAASAELREKEKTSREELFRNVAEQVQRFADENRTLLIRAPRSTDEIRAEGDALHHCVGNYASSMAHGTTYIMFVRKKDNQEEPYYTVEIDPDTLEIRQYRGYGNNVSKEHTIDPNVTKFLEKWNEKIKRKYAYTNAPDIAYGA